MRSSTVQAGVCASIFYLSIWKYTWPQETESVDYLNTRKDKSNDFLVMDSATEK